MTFFSATVERVRSSARYLRNTQALALCGLLLSLQVVLRLTGITIQQTLRLSFGFLMTAATGMLFGPVMAAIQGALADLLGTMLFPEGAFFPGFTLTALLGGLVYGFVLYQRPWNWPRLLLAKAGVNLLLNTLLNTYWLTLIQGRAMGALIWPRFLKNLALLPIELVLLVALAQLLCRMEKRIPGIRGGSAAG